MNISSETIAQLEAIYNIGLLDDNINDVPKERATSIHIVWEKETGEYIGKTIKAKKGEMTFQWIMDKINADSIYKSFANEFNSIVKQYGLSGYPTTYGIGVFVAVGFRSSIQEAKNKIASALDQLGVKYTNEHSEAGWVFRYKISKSKENIEAIKATFQ